MSCAETLQSPFCIVRLDSTASAKVLLSRCILATGIYELLGHGDTYDALRDDVLSRSSRQLSQYRKLPFRFTLDCFQGTRSTRKQREIIESFGYLNLEGQISMKNAELDLWILEDYSLDTTKPKHSSEPKHLYLGRFLGSSGRKVVPVYDLKKRKYISTTSMDSELALVTANLALAVPGKLIYDPFTGTGSFPVACAHFGATVIGSDIDGRSIRGSKGRNVFSNFQQYGLEALYLDSFISDLTNTPLRKRRWLDGIVCDPPYGVREGLKVLGSPKPELQKEVRLKDGRIAHLQSDYIPPKRAYSFEAMLDDILDFAAAMLVDEGRLCMWMPTANDEDVELAIPAHPALEITSVCVQSFNKWSRRLLTYRRLPNCDIDQTAVRRRRELTSGATADELNSFRRKAS
ncbi:hypothetical protein LTR50_004826 [Elasticomyces elasticus]|nr:hypothetical protein LTR50_004826 [Elasticomyces elasticus]